MPPNDTPFDYALTLQCHAATPAPVVRTIDAHAFIRLDGGITLAYRLWGDMARLLIPEASPPERTDSLWEHTCFEAFIGVADDTAYREFNFSPSGQWAAYAFSAYRRPDDSTPPINAPQISTRRFASRLEIEAILPAEALPTGATLQIALSAVVEAADTVDGSHSYWALHHPAERPDFHRRDAFILELAVPHNVA
jgi:hypothetical protein